MMRRRSKIILLLVILVTGFSILHFLLPLAIIYIRPSTAITHTIIPSFGNNPLKGKRIEFTTHDQLTQVGYLTYAQLEKAKGTVILLHGIRSKKEHFIELSRTLSEQGFNSVALDLRAHGESEGKYCTFGVKEKQDISLLIDYLIQKENIKTPIGIWGQSLGGAVALQALGTDSRLQFGIIESTFSDFETIVGDYAKHHLGFAFKPLLSYLVYRAGVIATFDPQHAKPGEYCKKIKQPILMVHGDVDDRISIKYGKSNFDNIPHDDKEFMAIKGAHHLNVWQVGGKEYFDRIMSFLLENADS